MSCEFVLKSHFNGCKQTSRKTKIDLMIHIVPSLARLSAYLMSNLLCPHLFTEYEARETKKKFQECHTIYTFGMRQNLGQLQIRSKLWMIWWIVEGSVVPKSKQYSQLPQPVTWLMLECECIRRWLEKH